MSAFKTFAQYVRQKEWAEAMDPAADATQQPDPTAAKDVTGAAAKAMRQMQGKQVIKAVTGEDPNAQKKLLTKTLQATAAKQPVNIGKVSKILNVGQQQGTTK